MTKVYFISLGLEILSFKDCLILLKMFIIKIVNPIGNYIEKINFPSYFKPSDFPPQG
jgi:hypothetical protein